MIESPGDVTMEAANTEEQQFWEGGTLASREGTAVAAAAGAVEQDDDPPLTVAGTQSRAHCTWNMFDVCQSCIPSITGVLAFKNPAYNYTLHSGSQAEEQQRGQPDEQCKYKRNDKQVTQRKTKRMSVWALTFELGGVSYLKS